MALLLGAGLLGVGGCGGTKHPRGTGASGTMQFTATKVDLGLDLINRLNPAQQKSFDYLHRPFVAVAKVNEKLSPERLATLEKIKKEWDGIRFAGLKEDFLATYKLTIKTDAGNLDYLLINNYMPNICRALLIEARLGLFNGTRLRLENGQLCFGQGANEVGFHCQSTAFPVEPRQGILVAYYDPARGAEADRFCVISKERNEDLKGKVTVVGQLGNDIDVVKKVKEAAEKNPEGLVIREVEIAEIKGPLFTEQGPNLPMVNARGEIDLEATMQQRPPAN